MKQVHHCSIARVVRANIGLGASIVLIASWTVSCHQQRESRIFHCGFRADIARSPIEFEVVVARRSATVGGEIVAKAWITNNTERAVSIPDPRDSRSPQPVYTLLSPDGDVVSLRAGAILEGSEVIAAREISIGPGETWVGSLAIDGSHALRVAGEYELRAQIVWKEIVAVAQPFRFRIEEATPSQAPDAEAERSIDVDRKCTPRSPCSKTQN
jgi:hypothetical protein